MINNILVTIILIIVTIALIILTTFLSILLWNKVYKSCLEDAFVRRTKKKVIKKLTSLKEELEYLELEEDVSEETLDDFRNEIDKYEKMLNTFEEMDKPEPFVLKDAILSEKIKDQINEMISVEVYAVLRECINLRTKYNITNLDSDITKISTNVVNGINPLVLETNMIMTNNFLMTYVVNQAFNLMLNIVTEHNLSIIE